MAHLLRTHPRTGTCTCLQGVQGRKKCPIHFIRAPGLDDVRLGRGSSTRLHPGNIAFRARIENYRDEYARTTTLFDRQQIQGRVYQETTQMGGRFLMTDDEGLWIEVSRTRALRKIREIISRVRSSSPATAAVPPREEQPSPHVTVATAFTSTMNHLRVDGSMAGASRARLSCTSPNSIKSKKNTPNTLDSSRFSMSPIVFPTSADETLDYLLQSAHSTNSLALSNTEFDPDYLTKRLDNPFQNEPKNRTAVVHPLPPQSR